MTSPAPVRLHHLDGLRAFLMLFGIPYHAALAFSGQQWVVTHHDEQSAALTWTTQLIHLWRMPAFFVIAGYFALSMADRKGAGSWYRSRLSRLGPPCLFGLLLVNPLQLLVAGLIDGDTVQQLAVQWWGSPDKVLHMWFLMDLLVYCGLLALVLTVTSPGALRGRIARITDAAYASPSRSLALLALVAGGVAAGLHAWYGLDLTVLSGGLMSSSLVRNAPAFGLGVLLALRPPGGRQLSASVRRGLVVTAAACLLLVHARNAFPSSHVLHNAVDTVGGLVWAVVLLRLARSLLDRPHRWVDWLVDASLVVYVVHHLFVVLFASLLIPGQLSPLAGFACTTTATLLASLLCYELVMRTRLLRRVLMGDAGRATSVLDVLPPGGSCAGPAAAAARDGLRRRPRGARTSGAVEPRPG